MIDYRQKLPGISAGAWNHFNNISNALAEGKFEMKRHMELQQDVRTLVDHVFNLEQQAEANSKAAQPGPSVLRDPAP